MADPLDITPDGLEILVARDLRKAGLEVDRLRRRGQVRSEDGSGDYRLDLTARLGAAGAVVLVECHRRPDPLGAEAVAALGARVAEEPAGRSGGPAAGMLLCTAGFTATALSAAAAGIPLLRVADARASYDASGWGARGQYPMWLPEHVLELATRGAAGSPAYEMLAAGAAPRLLGAMGLQAG